MPILAVKVGRTFKWLKFASTRKMNSFEKHVKGAGYETGMVDIDRHKMLQLDFDQYIFKNGKVYLFKKARP